MTTILVAYATMAGSTADVAQVVAEELIKNGVQAEVLPLSQVSDFSAYDAIVVGAPMIMGWHRSALRFLKKHRKTFILHPAFELSAPGSAGNPPGKTGQRRRFRWTAGIWPP